MLDRHVEFYLEGIKCQKCVDKIAASLEKDRVEFNITADINVDSIKINFNKAQTSTLRLKDQIRELGFLVKKIELIA
ncbi:MAG: hypothetical protein U0T83_00920 [Bacteriovoracaceae bacterium]